jgi:aminoglycoside phosphotransferase (APT) family kinase protein
MPSADETVEQASEERSAVLQLVPVVRAEGAFQQALEGNQILAVCRRSFGPDVVPLRAVELGGGTFNTLYRLEFDDREPLVLRVAPDDDRLSQADRAAQGMRNSHAAEPFFGAAGVVIPRAVRVDFTHDIVGRDYLIRETIEFQLSALVIELDQAGLPSSDLQQVLDHLQTQRSVLDAVIEPRLVHNDLWTVNVLVDEDDATPRITGVLDFDGAFWGDPMADWPIEQARLRAGTTADAFWQGYGVTDMDLEAHRRGLFYRARLLVGSRLDIHRRGLDLNSVPPKFWDLVPVLALLND